MKRNDMAAHALAEYKQAIMLFEKTPHTPRTTHAAAMAKLVLADVDLEHMLLDHLPTDLDFDSAPSHQKAKQESMRRLSKWIEDESHSGSAVTKLYTDVLAMKDVEASMGAVTRLGQTTEAFWRALLVGEIPRSIKTGDFAKEKLAAYCEHIRDAAEPLAARAAETFATCLAKSTELGAGNTWTPICQREGHLVAPDKFPDAHELMAAPSAQPLPIAIERSLKQ